MRGLTIVALAVALTGASAHAQSCATDLPDAQTVKADGYTVMYRTRPAKIAVGRHFDLELLLCGAGPAVSVSVGAFMPEHGHGMNYKPTMKTLGAGRFEADGLMLHMPGRWEFRFDVERAGHTEHLKSAFVLR